MAGAFSFLGGLACLLIAPAIDAHQNARAKRIQCPPPNEQPFDFNDEESRLFRKLESEGWDDHHEFVTDFRDRYYKEHPNAPGKPWEYFVYLRFKQYCERHLKGPYNDYQARELSGLNFHCWFNQTVGQPEYKKGKVDYFKYG